jgi:hypothetical protein
MLKNPIYKKLFLFLFFLFLQKIIYSDVCQFYNRSSFGSWVDVDRDCQSTRDEVLISESLINVKFKTHKKCKVKSGKWLDPYNNKIFTDPRKLDIDHVVPLKEAFISGAWEWNREKRKRFANDLKYKHHLIAVSASANRSKGAKDPAKWLPQNKIFIKKYVIAWVKIKIQWGLTSNRKELNAIKIILRDHNIVLPKEALDYQCH